MSPSLMLSDKIDVPLYNGNFKILGASSTPSKMRNEQV